MLHVLKIAVVLFPLFLGAQLVIKPENLTKKENTYWDFNKTQIQSTGSYYQDILGATKDKHGKWIYYDKFGKIEEERNCYRGKLNGKVVLYYPNGKLKQEGYFKIIFQEGVNQMIELQDSVYREWHENGFPSREGYFELGKPKGIWKNYYYDGREMSYEEQIDSISYIKSFWLPDPKHTKTIVDGTGEMTLYHSTGAVKEWYNYKNGRQNGPFEEQSIYGYTTLSGSFIDGVKDGEWKFYYYTGNLEKTSVYRNGVLNGSYAYYYDKGQLNVSGNYIDGKKDGLWKWFTNTGSPDMQGNFVKDLQEGQWLYWYPTGEKSYTAHYTKGLKSGTWTYLYKDGSTFKKGDFSNDLKNGKWQTWYENGILLMDGVYSNGKEEGMWINYWDDGKVKNSVTFKAGLMNGEWKSFSPTGKPKLTGFYKNNDKTGKWTNYYENGSPKDIFTYKIVDKKSDVKYGFFKGHTVKESVKHGYSASFSNKDYKVLEEGNYKKGKKEGEWKEYFPGLKAPALISNFKAGELEGPMKEFDKGGKKISEINYSKGVKHGRFIIYGENGKILTEKMFAEGVELKLKNKAFK